MLVGRVVLGNQNEAGVFDQGFGGFAGQAAVGFRADQAGLRRIVVGDQDFFRRGGVDGGEDGFGVLGMVQDVGEEGDVGRDGEGDRRRGILGEVNQVAGGLGGGENGLDGIDCAGGAGEGGVGGGKQAGAAADVEDGHAGAEARHGGPDVREVAFAGLAA